MKRIAVVGNSHTVALKSATRLMDTALFDRVSFTFFASHIRYIPQLRIDPSGHLAPINPTFKHPLVPGNISEHLNQMNGRAEMALSGFDGTIWLGTAGGATRLQHPHEPVLKLLAETDVIGLRVVGHPATISLKSLGALLRRLADQHIGYYQEANLINPALPKTIVLMPPALAETAFGVSAVS
jgi:hypothetical protein